MAHLCLRKAVLAVLFSPFVAALVPRNDERPIVDLGYTLQQANSVNDRFYNFSNIRYGEPPVGPLRFTPPVAAKEDRTLQTGQIDRICYQGDSSWAKAISGTFADAYISGKMDEFYAKYPDNSSWIETAVPPAEPRETEDCLFLDVFASRKVFEQRGKKDYAGAPVMVWLFGGGYVLGEKRRDGTPEGILERSQEGGADGVIYVALNYRLGAFGWLAGKSLQANGTANLGLLDQRLALKWIQEHIHQFGGDPSKVTLFGESAGAGGTTLQITAYGGSKGPAPFAQAIAQSPGWGILPSPEAQEATAQRLLEILKIKTIQEAREVPAETLRRASFTISRAAPYGQFGFGPVVDGEFVPESPTKLIREGKFDKNVKMMLGHNANEGLIFTNPYINSSDKFDKALVTILPAAPVAVRDYVAQTLYPPPSANTPYHDQIGRASLLLKEQKFGCNTVFFARAKDNSTSNYLFSVGDEKALHGADEVYTYYHGDNAKVNETVALAMQRYFTTWAKSGTPDAPGLPNFPEYGDDSQVLDFGSDGIKPQLDDTGFERCAWWEQDLINA